MCSSHIAEFLDTVGAIEEEEVIESIIDGTYEQVPLDGTFSAKQ